MPSPDPMPLLDPMVVGRVSLYRVGMTNLPVPGPSGAGDPHAHLRASDADRDRVVRVLGEALSDGRLSPVEHSERLDAVYQAKTMGELAPITYDLAVVSAAQAQSFRAASDGQGPVVDPAGATDETDRLIGIFGGAERKGRWRVRRRTRAVAVFGGFDLDMTDATFDAPVVEIRLFAMFGGLNVKIPEGVEVDNRCGGILGGVSVKTGGRARPGAPVVVLKGLAILGGANIEVARPGS
jgi:hypothetical protein